MISTLYRLCISQTRALVMLDLEFSKSSDTCLRTLPISSFHLSDSNVSNLLLQAFWSDVPSCVLPTTKFTLSDFQRRLTLDYQQKI